MSSKISLRGWDIVVALVRLACGGLFIYSSLDKLDNAALFSKFVENYHVLPMALVPLAAVVIPWLEFFTGLCLVAGFRWRGAALIFFILVTVYVLALSWNLLNGVEMNCGCFSMESQEKLSIWTVLRDVIFLAMGFLVLTSSRMALTLDSVIGGKDS
jgi:uncharacterized membrane protein YphA (DoxX/SURF4 family)